MGSIFTYAGFRDFLNHAKRYGEFIPLKEWRAGGIILRHDADLDVRFAHRLALLEADCGVRGTYFFMITGPYNPLSALNRDVLREIFAMGFEIGLHFNPAVYEKERLKEAVTRELEMLGSVGVPVRSVSLHDPTRYGSYPTFANCFNAYDPRIFSDAVYFSDSGMGFRGKDPYIFVERRGDRTLQMLFHPEHFSESGHGYGEIFREHLRCHCETVDWFWNGSQTYKGIFPSGLFNAVAGRPKEVLDEESHDFLCVP